MSYEDFKIISGYTVNTPYKQEYWTDMNIQLAIFKKV